MATLLILEDGDEYRRYFARYLTEHVCLQAHDLGEALGHLRGAPKPDAFILDLRFDRVPRERLTGDVDEIADEMFAGDVEAAWRYIVDNQGFLLLGELRGAGFGQPALLITEMNERRVENLRKLYGAIDAVPTFDKERIARALGALLKGR